MILNFLDRVFAVLGALLFSQIPTFMQQYTQQLSGHVQELKLQLGRMSGTAQHSGKTLTQYIHKFLSSTDSDISQQGQLMHEMAARYQNLSEALISLNQASTLSKPFVFFQHFYSDIAASTFQLFIPGFSFSLEGIAYALLGILFATLLFSAFRTLFKKKGAEESAP